MVSCVIHVNSFFAMAKVASSSIGLHRPKPFHFRPYQTLHSVKPFNYQLNNLQKYQRIYCQTEPKTGDCCQPSSDPYESAVKEKSSIDPGAGAESSKAEVSPPSTGPEYPTRDFNRRVALVSVIAALGLFSSQRLDLGVSLKDITAAALPYEEALSNGKPTVVANLHFTSYSDQGTGGVQKFTIYSQEANAGDQYFKSYGKNGNGANGEFVSYGNDTNVIGSTFTNYGQTANGGDQKFTSYGFNGNVPENHFTNYGAGGNGPSETFNSYRDQSNVGDDTFTTYVKDANGGEANFTNYGQSFNEGTDVFTTYGKGGNDPHINFKTYGVNNTFKDYVKDTATFSNYHNKTSQVLASLMEVNGGKKVNNRWVEPGKFFREKMLKSGTIMPMPDIKDKMPKRSFLPRVIASKLPFSTSKIAELKKIFHAGDESQVEKMIGDALSECERAPSAGETKRCVNSAEDMIDFATSVLGRNVVVRTTEDTKGSNGNIMIGSVKGINGGKVTKSVSCHQTLYPYLLYYCHSVPKVRVYEADILDPNSKVKINHGVAICHVDTSSWGPSHGAFVALGSGPGKIEVCHWIFENDMTWAIAD